MDPSGGRQNDSRYNLNYSMAMMNDNPEIYGNPNVLSRPPSNFMNTQCGSNNINNNNNIIQATSRGLKRTNSDCYDHERAAVNNNNNNSMGLHSPHQLVSGVILDNCGSSSITDVNSVEESYTTLTQQQQQQQQQQLNKKTPPSNGKKTKGRVKIKMEYIDNKLRRYTTFSKRKTGIMKKAYELSTLTGTQVMLLVASETGHVYTFATRKLQPMITSEAGKALIQTCLNSPDPPTSINSGDQRMSATGFEETELSYNIGDEDSKVRQLVYGHGHHGHAHLGHPQPSHYGLEQGLMQQSYSSGGQSSPLSHPQSYPPHPGHSHHPHVTHPHMTHSHAQR